MVKPSPQTDPHRFVEAISKSNMTIYDPIEVGDPELWIPTPEMETLLDKTLSGVSLASLPLRTRSKVVKEHVCRALGYPAPASFKKTQPRFPGLMLDTYVQKSNNLQIWNEELAPSRRYAVIRVGDDDRIVRVKVVTGATLARLDTTGTLTQKYQARCIPRSESSELVAATDTERLRGFVSSGVVRSFEATPLDNPMAEELLSIHVVYERLRPLIGRRFSDAGSDQERNRGAALHRLVCEALGYASYQDDGQFPDVRHQLLEVKLACPHFMCQWL